MKVQKAPDTFHIISPVDGAPYQSRSLLVPGEASAAVVRAREAQALWAELPLEQRIEMIGAVIPAITSKADDIATELAWQMGRPVRFGPKEIAGVVERTRSQLEAAPKALESIDFGATGGKFIERVPHGVALVVAPWNYPLLTAINAIVAALLAGNAVILKPALQTALTGERLAEAFGTAGLPAGVFQSLLLDHETIAAWLRSRKVDFVSFTGSVRAGGQIEAAAAGQFLPISLELGGKDPAYVRSDADIESAAENLVDGAFFNSGQSCCGIERIYVEASRFDDFLDCFQEVQTRSQKLGDPTDPQTTLGPVVSRQAAAGIRAQVASAMRNGAKALGDILSLDDDSPYLAATTLIGVDHSMAIMTEETFGPVVGIMPVRDDEEALRLMNDSRYGLTASIWTRDRDAALALGRRLNTGTVFHNRCDYLDPELAWVGVKDSGRGCSLSALSFHQVTRPKSFNFARVA